jgi:hypothetical protein
MSTVFFQARLGSAGRMYGLGQLVKTQSVKRYAWWADILCADGKAGGGANYGGFPHTIARTRVVT